MGKRDDQRITTKLAILAPFERLCERSTYTEISVADICQEASISKPTFYRHFQSKDNIIRWVAKRSIKGGVAGIGRTCTWYEGYLNTMNIQYKHRAIFSDKQTVEVVGSLFSFSTKFRREQLITTIKEKTGADISDKISFQIEALMVVESVMSRSWSVGGMQTPPSIMADYTTSCVPRDLFELLNEPMEPAQ